MSAELEPVAGVAEGRGEEVLRGRVGAFSYVVTHEYEGAPWGWVIVEGERDLIAAGDSATKEQALADVAHELEQIVTLPAPAAPAPPAPRTGGLVGIVGRLLWGE